MQRRLPIAELDPSQQTIVGTKQDAYRALDALGVAAETLGHYLEHPLSAVDVEELENISLAVTPKENAEQAGLEPEEIVRLRREAVKSTGVTTGTAAVRVAIVSGLIPIQFDIGHRTKPLIEDQTRLVIALTSLGLSALSIANETSLPKRVVSEEISEAKEALGAGNTAHLVRRAFESGVLENPDEQYHQAVRLGTLLEGPDVDFPLEEVSSLTRGLILQNGASGE